MPDRPPSPRPRGVTVAGITATAACALLVVVLLDAMASIRSSENQDAVRRFLSTPPGSSLGLGVSQVLDLMHVVVLVSGALAAAGAVLAAYTLRRHRGARVGLSVVAVLMVLLTTFVAGLLPFVVAFAAAMLWRQDARDWFDGREPRPRPAVATPPSVPTAQAGPTPSWEPIGQPQPDPEPQAQPSAQPSAQPYGQPYAQPYGRPNPYAHTPAYPQPAPRRPASVIAAACITWVLAGLTALVLLLLAVTLVVDSERLITALQENPDVARVGYTRDQLFAALWVITAMGLAWSLAAVALAVLAFRGVRAGRVGLLVSAAGSGLLGLATVVVPLAAVVTIVLLLRRDARAWFSRSRADQPPRPPVW